jgi:protein-L-isoaspartate(D-aspartate) O-methyltransferase
LILFRIEGKIFLMGRKKTVQYLLAGIFLLSLCGVNTRRLHADEYATLRRSMVENQIKNRGITDKKILDAMLTVPRHRFVPSEYLADSYEDRPLPIGEGQTISQPYIVALMCEKLSLKPSDRVLEVGTGSGYHAAVISRISKEVLTVEIIPPLGEKSSKILKTLGYDNVRTRIGDGYYGWEEHAPFDAIVVTAAATHIPPPLIKQLKPKGRMVIPVGGVFQIQNLMLVRKDTDGKVTTETVCPVRFVPLTGGPRNQ